MCQAFPLVMAVLAISLNCAISTEDSDVANTDVAFERNQYEDSEMFYNGSIPFGQPSFHHHYTNGYHSVSASPSTLELFDDFLLNVYQELYEKPARTGRNLVDRQSFFSNGLAGVSEYLMSSVENSLEDLPSLPRLDAQECMKRSVCEAHNQPKKYGLMGLILQLLFPPYTKTDDISTIVSKYQLAARYGRQNNANCAAQYDGCMLNVLDLVQAVVNLFIR